MRKNLQKREIFRENLKICGKSEKYEKNHMCAEFHEKFKSVIGIAIAFIVFEIKNI